MDKNYRLFKNDPSDPPEREISFEELNDKAFWCSLGAEKEKAFVKFMSEIDSPYVISIHPEKQNDPYHPDLLVKIGDKELIGEAKIKNSPLFIARKYGADPQHALTMDLKDSFNYSRRLRQGIDLLIFAWVKWEAHEMVSDFHGRKRVSPMHGIWVARFSKLRAKEKSENPPEIHWYREDFRKPRKYDLNAPESKVLLQFEPRLKKRFPLSLEEWAENKKLSLQKISRADELDYVSERLKCYKVNNITSGDLRIQDGIPYPTGHSSASYVFDLSDEALFENIYLSCK